MQRKVLTWEECASLTVQWYELNHAKIKRIAWASLRDSKYEKNKQVLCTPPLLLTNNNNLTPTPYIVNGKHRALHAYLTKRSTDAIIAQNRTEIEFSTPQITHGGNLAEVVENYDFRYNYITICKKHGIVTIEDLAKKYNLILQ
jgi:hypothetical protein